MIKEANLLCGDAIANFRTVQSFGHNEEIVKKFEEFLLPSLAVAKMSKVKGGVAYGVGQAAQYFVFALEFYLAGYILQEMPEFSPSDVFLALFIIMFSAMHLGFAQSMGPDMGKANAAAERIFGIIEAPSRIDAIEMDSDESLKTGFFETCKGKIEFRNVWFRYPTRK